MRKQFLYIRKPGFYYSGPGNIRIGPGSKGTVSFWFHGTPDYPSRQTLWKAMGDSSNLLRVGVYGVGTLSFECQVGTSAWAVTWPDFLWPDHNYWLPIACTWDFTTPGAGRLRLYVNGQEAPNQVDNAQAPAVEASKLYLGPPLAEVAEPTDGCFDNFAVWDGVMTKGQHDALWGQAANWGARQDMRRRLLRESDGTGHLTLLATFDGTYDAQVAGGDAAAHWEATATSYDEFCRLDDGSRGRGLRHQFFFGRPRHDNTPDDRVPLRAVLTTITNSGADRYTTITNHTNYSQIEVGQLYGQPWVGQGMGWLREWINPFGLARPATVRMRVQCPSETNPVGTMVSLGPLCYINGGQHGNNWGGWGTGELFAVVTDAGNTASRFKTSLTGRGDGYWTGAELTMRTGTGAGCRLKVTGYTASTGVLVVSGALPAAPAAGDKGVVDFRGRLLANANPLDEQQSMEAWLWEEYGSDRAWIELECVYSEDASNTFVRYQRGRTVLMNLTNQRSDPLGRCMMFGRNVDHPVPSSYQCDLRLESLVVEGPGSYQAMSPQSSALGRGFELADTFLLRDPDIGQSPRVWRQSGVTWQTAPPSVDPDPASLQTDLQQPGTWRHQALLHSPVEPQARLDQVTAMLTGSDPDGVWRGGYLVGSWDEARHRVTWTDEAPPLGKANPFMNVSDEVPWVTRDSRWGMDAPGPIKVLGTADGQWSMLWGGTEGNPDHYLTRALHGATDRWSFSRERHWWAENPLVPGMGGVEKLSADSGSIGLWGNREADWIVAYNPYTRQPERRFLSYTRLKTMLLLGDFLSANRRPVGGWTSGDLKTFFLLPHGNAVSPLPVGDSFTLHPRPVSDDFTLVLLTGFSPNIMLWATDDDRHFQPVRHEFLTGSGMRASFLLGDRLVLYYDASGVMNMAYIGRDREAYYGLTAGATTGWLETAVLEKPAEGWARLLVSSTRSEGAVRVEVLDPETDDPLPGLSAADCTPLAGGVDEGVTWGGLSLTSVPADAVRLRFVLERPTASAASPTLNAWYAVDRGGSGSPVATGLRVEGRVNPIGIVDATPLFSWEYSDPNGKVQKSCQVLVASGPEKLEASQGDVWDSGVVTGDEWEAEYGGPALAEETTYFWKVRVQNSEGEWSETW